MANCVVLLDKQPGLTSYTSLRVLKKALGKKSGHAGTLDKFASGLLISFSGKCTKLNDVFMGLEKTYIAQISFGSQTDTLDPEGEVVATSSLPSYEDIKLKLETFIGEIDQVPPAYSAIHIDGKRSYELARSNAEFTIPSKRVKLHEYEILEVVYENDLVKKLLIKIRVSKGFYVRSFARDLANSVGSCAFVSELRRNQIGPFSVDEAVLSDDLEAITNKATNCDLKALLLRIPGFIYVPVKNENQFIRLKDGLIAYHTFDDVDKSKRFALLGFEDKLGCVVDLKTQTFVCNFME